MHERFRMLSGLSAAGVVPWDDGQSDGMDYSWSVHGMLPAAAAATAAAAAATAAAAFGKSMSMSSSTCERALSATLKHHEVARRTPRARATLALTLTPVLTPATRRGSRKRAQSTTAKGLKGPRTAA